MTVTFLVLIVFIEYIAVNVMVNFCWLPSIKLSMLYYTNICNSLIMPPKELWEAYSNGTVRPSVRPASCPVHIFNILWGRISKFGVWMHLGMAECRLPFSGHCDLDLWLSFYSNHYVRPSVLLRVRCISPIFFEVGFPNLMCGCILGWRSVTYYFRVTVTLTSDLVFRIIMSGANLLYYLR